MRDLPLLRNWEVFQQQYWRGQVCADWLTLDSLRAYEAIVWPSQNGQQNTYTGRSGTVWVTATQLKMCRYLRKSLTKQLQVHRDRGATLRLGGGGT